MVDRFRQALSCAALVVCIGCADGAASDDPTSRVTVTVGEHNRISISDSSEVVQLDEQADIGHPSVLEGLMRAGYSVEQMFDLLASEADAPEKIAQAAGLKSARDLPIDGKVQAISADAFSQYWCNLNGVTYSEVVTGLVCLYNRTATRAVFDSYASFPSVSAMFRITSRDGTATATFRSGNATMTVRVPWQTVHTHVSSDVRRIRQLHSMEVVNPSRDVYHAMSFRYN